MSLIKYIYLLTLFSVFSFSSISLASDYERDLTCDNNLEHIVRYEADMLYGFDESLPRFVFSDCSYIAHEENMRYGGIDKSSKRINCESCECPIDSCISESCKTTCQDVVVDCCCCFEEKQELSGYAAAGGYGGGGGGGYGYESGGGGGGGGGGDDDDDDDDIIGPEGDDDDDDVIIPEPSTWIILGSLLTIAAFCKRRKRVNLP